MTPRDDLLTSSEVCRRTTLSRAELYRRMGAGTFPRPKQLGGQRVAWVAGEVQDWVNALPRSEAA